MGARSKMRRHMRAATRTTIAIVTVVLATGGALVAAPAGALPATVTAHPSGATIVTGTLRGGTVADLAADDWDYYEVNSTTTGTRTVEWYASFTGVPATADALAIKYMGMNSRNCGQTISVYKFSNSTWVQLDSRTVGTSEVAISGLKPPLTQSTYIGPSGEVRARVRCTTTANFYTRGGLFELTYATAPIDPALYGSWANPAPGPLVSIHSALMPNGKVVMLDWEGGTADNDQLFDPATGSYTKIPVPWGDDLACAGQVTIADGRLMVVGGTPAYDGLTTTSLYNSTTNTWTRGADMARSRWYPTITPLSDGRVLVVSGDSITLDHQSQPDPLINYSYTIPEIYNPVTNTWTSISTAARIIPLYPFMFLLPDGRLFDAGPDKTTRTLNLTSGTWSTVGTSPIDGHSAVMYRPGKVLKTGKWSDPSDEIPHGNSNNRAATIDMTKASPTWQEISPMTYARTYQTLTVLPDGKVLAMGGETGTEGFDDSKAVLPAEMWDPGTGNWTELARMQTPRLYHSTSLLLPDGRVLLSGGGRVGYTDQTSTEIFSPPYLFKGPRPTITNAPGTLSHGASFTVTTPDASRIDSVSLMHVGSPTHGIDMGQSFVPLNFTKNAGSLTVSMTGNPNTAPPGQYMLFIVDSSGVPSVASMVKVPLPGTDSVAPTAPTGLSANGGLGQASLTWTAATDNIGVATYNVHRSTVSGFTPSDATRVGQVSSTSFTDSGVPAGTYYYKVTAQDTAGNVGPPSGQASAVVTADTTPPSVSITSPTGGGVAGTIAIGANAGDNVAVAGVQIRIDGVPLGAEDTTAPYTGVWDTRLVPNGSHAIDAVARDTSGNTATSASVPVTVANTGTPGLVGRWSFDEPNGTVATDGSGNSNNGTLVNATRVAGGKFGGAVSLNGTNALVTVPDSASLDLTTGMTMEAWVNPAVAMGSTWRSLLMKEQPGGEAWGMYANIDTGRPDVEAMVSNGASASAAGTVSVPPNAWTASRGNVRRYNGAFLCQRHARVTGGAHGIAENEQQSIQHRGQLGVG